MDAFSKMLLFQMLRPTTDVKCEKVTSPMTRLVVLTGRGGTMLFALLQSFIVFRPQRLGFQILGSHQAFTTVNSEH